MHQERCGQRRIFMLDKKRPVRAHEAGVPPDLGDRAALRNQNSLGPSPVAISARDTWLLRIDKKKRMIDGDRKEGKLDRLLASHRECCTFNNLGNFDGLQRLVCVKDQSDIVT